MIPTLLLFLYPCRCCQRILNKAKCNSPVLRTYMDVFQGHYKDGTNNSKDFQYFAGIFLVAMVFAVVQCPLLTVFSLDTTGMSMTVLALSVTIIHPQRCHARYILNSMYLSFVSIIMFSFIGYVIQSHTLASQKLLQIFFTLSLLSPLVYFTLIVLYWIIRKKRIPQRILVAVRRRARKCLGSSEEYTHLVEQC